MLFLEEGRGKAHLPEMLLFFSKLKECNYYGRSFSITWLEQSKFLVDYGNQRYEKVIIKAKKKIVICVIPIAEKTLITTILFCLFCQKLSDLHGKTLTFSSENPLGGSIVL